MICRFLSFGILGFVLTGCSGADQAPSVGSSTPTQSTASHLFLTSAHQTPEHYSQKVARLIPKGGIWHMPRIDGIRLEFPYASNSAGETFVGSVISADYNVGGQYPQPSGLTVDWYGTIDFEAGCSATCGAANLTAKIVASKLHRTESYYLLFYDLHNNLIETVSLGQPPKSHTFTFPTLFENGFTSSPCGVNMEIAY